MSTQDDSKAVNAPVAGTKAVPAPAPDAKPAMVENRSRPPAADLPDDAVRTAEFWAHHLGHLPEYTREAPPADKPKKTMPRVYNPKSQLYLSARHHHTWPVGKEITKAGYLEAVKAATTHVFR